MEIPAPYARQAPQVIERILPRLDAEPASPTYGCFDRTWWCWKFSDFPAPRFQEGIYTLAWLATSPHAPQSFHHHPALLAKLEAAMNFWAGLQHRDGSFDEAYPYERSLAATAFTSFYIGHAAERLQSLFSPATFNTCLQTLEKSATWLQNNGEYHGILSNHLAAAAAALQTTGDLLNTTRFHAARHRYLGIIYREQDMQEGWMCEYGGADPGYQSHGMFYLTDIWRRTADPELLHRLDLATQFIAHFLHPDGSLGGEYASRGTRFAFPAAFEILAPRIPMAAAVAHRLREDIANNRGIGPHQMDEWNLFPMLNNWLFAADSAADLHNPPPLPLDAPGQQKLFPNAGIFVASTQSSHIVLGLKTGGVVKVWNRATRALTYEDCGYQFISQGKSLVSQGPAEWHTTTDSQSQTFTIASPFGNKATLRFTPWLFIGFRITTLLSGILPAASRWIKDLLVKVLVRKKNAPATATLHRTIRLGSNSALTLTDRISAPSDSLHPLSRNLPYHMGSSRYSNSHDFLGAAIQPAEPSPASEPGVAIRTTTLEV